MQLLRFSCPAPDIFCMSALCYLYAVRQACTLWQMQRLGLAMYLYPCLRSGQSLCRVKTSWGSKRQHGGLPRTLRAAADVLRSAAHALLQRPVLHPGPDPTAPAGHRVGSARARRCQPCGTCHASNLCPGGGFLKVDCRIQFQTLAHQVCAKYVCRHFPRVSFVSGFSSASGSFASSEQGLSNNPLTQQSP